MDHLLSTRARRATSSAIRDLLRVTASADVLSLAGGIPAPELFPVAELRAIVDDLLGERGAANAALQYGPTEGTDELRAQVASATDLARASGRGPRCTIDQVVITTGSQQALDLLARVLLDPEDVVVVESPAYLGALQALRGAAPNIVPVEVDDDGLDVDHLEALLARGMRPKLCYVVANFSNPSGATLSVDRRRRLAALADRHGFVVVEDDPYGALRFTGEPTAPIGAFGENVVSLGSSSKTLAPGLRVGWAVGPRWLMPHLVTQKQSADLHTSSLAQAVVARALTAPWFPAHLTTLRTAYAARAEALCDALDARPDAFARAARPSGGMFVWARFAHEVDATALLARAIGRGVAFVPGVAFTDQARYQHHARLSFATLEPEALRVAVERLADAAGRLETTRA